MGRINWSAYDPLEQGSTNEDPLGFYAYALRLAEEWLPGITTRTRRIRYYSMVCGGLLLIEQDLSDILSSAQNRDAERIRLFLRWERLWTLWNVALDEATLPGLIGRLKTEHQFKNDRFIAGSLDYPFIQRQPDLGALGSYRSSLQAFGLLRWDVTELTMLGKEIGELFWSHNGVRRARNRCAQALRSGRIVFPRSTGKLGTLGAKLGLHVPLARQACGPSLKKELDILNNCLFAGSGPDVRRKEVLDYICRHDLRQMDEGQILETAALGASKADGGTELDRRAAAILALERYRAVLLSIINLFRAHLLERGGAQSPTSLSRSSELKSQTREARVARKQLLRFTSTAQFGAVFSDFPNDLCLDNSDGVSLLRRLLHIHEEEMAQRKSPRWFFRSAPDAWELDPSVAYPPDEDGPVRLYSYRTANLMIMAQEVGRRI